MLRHIRTLAVSLLLSCFLFSCTPAIQNEPEPEPAGPDVSAPVLSPAEESAQSQDALGRCRRSSYDPKVREMQPILLYLGYYRGTVDGCKGPKTVAAVEKFQGDSGLPATGEVDEMTEAALQEAKSRKGRTASPPPIIKAPREKPAPPQQTCSDKLRQMQGILRELGYYTGALDGCPGPNLSSAVRQFQQKTKLPATGELDGATEAALLQ